MKLKDALALTGFAAVTLLATVPGGLTARKPKTWYRALRKPKQNPPDQAFGIVWPVLYALIAFSGYRAWKHRQSAAGKRALALWGTQLFFNAAWSPLFFGAHKARLAMADLALTLGTAAAYTAQVAVLDKQAAWVMAPYLGWLGFASTLNAGIIAKNPKLLAG